MLCQRCKTNMATVHYSETVNGEHREYYLCPSCAAMEGFAGHALLERSGENRIFELFKVRNARKYGVFGGVKAVLILF